MAFIIISIIIVGLSLSYVKSSFDKISCILDQIISKKDNILFSDTKDSRLSRLVHQSKKIIQMVQRTDEHATKEKEVIKRLIGDISHQLKTPFASMKMYTELLEDDSLSKDEISKYVYEIKTQNEKMEWMIASLLKTSRLESGAIEFKAERLMIKQTIADSVGAMYPLLEEHNIEIYIDDFQDLALLHHRKWTIEVLNNIIENAIKYSKKNSKIVISVEKLDLYTIIKIRDFGLGIKKEDHSLIFNRFYRGDHAENYKGAGIGLFLSSSIMAKQGGYIMVDSELGRGSVFSIYFRNIY